MRKKIMALFIFVLSLLLVFTLVACDKGGNDGDKKPDDKPVKTDPTLDDLWAEAINKAMDGIKITPSKNMGWDVDLDIAASKQGEFDFDLGLIVRANLNLNQDANEQMKAVVSLVDNKTNKAIIDLAADKDFFYIGIGDTKYKFNNVDLFTILNHYLDEITAEDIDVGNLASTFLSGMGSTLFTEGSVNEAGNVYTFKFSMKALLLNEDLSVVLDLIEPTLGIDLVQTILDLVQADSVETMTDITADVIITVNEGQPAGISLKKIEVAGIKVDADINKFVASSNFINDITIASEEYTEAMLGRFSGQGDFSFMTKNAADQALESFADYNWELDVNIDLGTLILNDFNFDALPDDNYLYFAITQNVPEGSAYFASKFRNESGPVIEIGWQKTSLGTSNLFAMLSAERLLNKANTIAFAGQDISSVIKGAISFNIDPMGLMAKNQPIPESDMTITPNASAEAFDLGSIGGTIDTIKGIFALIKGGLNTTEKSLTLDLGALFKTLNVDASGIMPTLNSLLSTESNPLDGLKVAVDNFSITAPATENMNVYNKMFASKMDEANFDICNGKPGPTGNVVLGYEAENQDGVVTVYGDQYGNSVVFDKNTKMSAAEFAEALMKGGKYEKTYVKVNTTNIWKGENPHKNDTKFCKVLGVKGIDYNSTGAQTVSIIYANPNTPLMQMLLNILQRQLNFQLDDYIPATAETTVTFAAEESWRFELGANSQLVWRFGETVELEGTMFIKQKGSDVETAYELAGIVDPADVEKGIFDEEGAVQYSTEDRTANILFTYAGHTFKQQITIPGVKSIEAAPSVPTAYVGDSANLGGKLTVVYNDKDTAGNQVSKQISVSATVESEFIASRKFVKAGKLEFSYEYSGYKANVSIDIYGIKEIAVNDQVVTGKGYVGTSISKNDALRLVYDNDFSKIVDAEKFTIAADAISGGYANAAGKLLKETAEASKISVTFSYQGEEVTAQIAIIGIKSISVRGDKVNAKYYSYADKISKKGVLDVEYKDGHRIEEVNADTMTFDSASTAAGYVKSDGSVLKATPAGTKVTVTFEYNDVTVDKQFEIIGFETSGVAIKSNAYASKTYKVGNYVFTSYKVTCTVTYADGVKKDVAAAVSLEADKNDATVINSSKKVLKTGNVILTFTIGDWTYDYTIQITE